MPRLTCLRTTHQDQNLKLHQLRTIGQERIGNAMTLDRLAPCVISGSVFFSAEGIIVGIVES